MDHVSNLPDELLCHILSFFTTKEAALTSVLSKRWRNLFVSGPNVNIDDSEFLHPEEGKRERDGVLESFVEFVDRVLELQETSTINKLSLKCRTGVDANRVDHWIYNALARGVTDLDLCIVFGSSRYWLHPRGFESRKLVKLKIGSGIDLGWCTGSIYLPMLKTLVLESVEFCADYNLKMLLPACPALEELEMYDVKGLDSNETVSSASLKNLIIKSSLVSSGSFSFDTPSLVYLGYSDFIPEDYPLANLQNLSEARINISLTDDQVERARFPNEYDDEYDDAVRLVNMAKLMSGMRNVQTLYFNSTTLEVLSLCCESMPVFNNLKVLGFYSGESPWQAVPVLLKNCPHLETLCITGLLHVVTETCGDVCDCIPREDKGRSITSCPVKRIEIEGFIGTMREITMISHFLEYFPCLEEILITVEGNCPRQLDVPEATDFRAQMLELYYKSFSCDVEIFVCESLSRKLTAQQNVTNNPSA
ncbi:unnamed protein product [Brassica rapa subsp. narinosa]